MSNPLKNVDLIQQNIAPMLKFSLPNLSCCINAHFVIRTLPFISLQPIPKAPEYIQGLCNLYGQSVMVIDLAKYIGLDEPINYSLNTPLIICSYNERLLGFIVENVDGIIKVDTDNIQLADEFQHNSPVFSGTLITEGHSIMVLKIEKLFDCHFQEFNTN
ncbi:MAG: hypothetical protein GQ569_10870 [Methylococcaceae bacterium]|nr:hypothetical protein [Methylococcaceae bacterium]